MDLSSTSRLAQVHSHVGCRVSQASRKGQAPMRKHLLILCLFHVCYCSIDQNKSHHSCGHVVGQQVQHHSGWALRFTGKGKVDTEKKIIYHTYLTWSV